MVFELEQLIKIGLIFILSAIMGLEREVSSKPAGLRTHILVGLGSTLLSILSAEAFPGSDPARVAAAVMVGIGFLGAGTILKTEEKIVGLTTAATLWITAAVGLAIGTGFYILAVIITALVYLSLKLDSLT